MSDIVERLREQGTDCDWNGVDGGIQRDSLLHEAADEIESLRTQLADATRKLEEARKAVKAMVEDGWLMHGPEGMSEPQQICYDVYQAIEQGKGGDEG
jgi:hypothetical protein